MSGNRHERSSAGWHALISDIHGNGVALEAVLRDIAGRAVDLIVCLGDIAAGGPQPRQVLARLRRLQCQAIRGNADSWLLTGLPSGSSDRTHRIDAIVRWAREMLGSSEVDYLAALPPALTIATSGWTLLCCHGSARSDIDAVLATTPETHIDELFSGHQAQAIACGHTHLQLLRRHKDRLLINPGSVGLPLGSLILCAGGYQLPAWAEYALIRIGRDEIEVVFRRVPVDTAALAQATEKMPYASWASDLEQRIERWNARSVS